jgi:3-hydroxyacyl-CoA dehydrogenase/enoyl-CoA hydratase/3-hydroxybutyryl-CoA epimerase
MWGAAYSPFYPKNGGFLRDFMPTSTQQNTLRFEVNDTGIATLWLDGGERPVVVLDRSLIQRLNTALDSIEQRDDINGLVLRSDCERVFIAGADLAEIDSLDDPALHAYLAFGTTVFGRISALPFPTVACLNGATLGGGLEVAMHCDGVIAAKTTSRGKPYPIGLPEAGLGICPGWGGSQMLPARIDPTTAMKATATGKPFMVSDLPEGLVDVLVETPDDLQEIAEVWIANHDSTQPAPKAICPSEYDKYSVALETAKNETELTEAAQGVFQAVETGIREGWAAAVAIEQCELVRLRNTPPAREKLEAFLSKG